MTKGNQGRKKTDVPGRSQRSATRNSDSDIEDDCECPCQGRSLLKLVNRITDLLESQTGLMAEIRDLRAECRNLKENHDRLLERVEELENSDSQWNPVRRHAVASADDVNALTTNVADELLARKDKELNIVIYGLEELPHTDEDEPSEEQEKTHTAQFLTSQLKVEDPSFTRVFRMGRRQTDRPRPIKVMFTESTKRAQTLDSAKSLGKLPEGNKYRRVFIRPDWTQLQRDQDYARRQAIRRQSDNRGRGRDRNQNDGHSPRSPQQNDRHSPHRPHQNDRPSPRRTRQSHAH